MPMPKQFLYLVEIDSGIEKQRRDFRTKGMMTVGLASHYSPTWAAADLPRV